MFNILTILGITYITYNVILMGIVLCFGSKYEYKFPEEYKDFIEKNKKGTK